MRPEAGRLPEFALVAAAPAPFTGKHGERSGRDQAPEFRRALQAAKSGSAAAAASTAWAAGGSPR